MSNPILKLHDLDTHYFTEQGILPAVDKVSLSLKKGETLGLVGESGCGKSAAALSVMRLIPETQGSIAAGEIIFEGERLLAKTEKELCRIRGRRMAMIFQEPMTSLNPVFTIGNQLREGPMLHLGLSRTEAQERAVEMLRLVGIPAPEQRMKEYPHQLSGGMRQRVMIAMALSCGPDLLIADEPTTALDVTVQAQILDLLKKIKQERDMTMLIISHDLGVISQIADRVAIMYAGQIVERAPTEELFYNAVHPYTKGLLASVPRIDSDSRQPLKPIPGNVPNLLDLPPGCRFSPRCPYVMEVCRKQIPALEPVSDHHHKRCFLK
ncbi:MAG: ABC transporter ATP-binding protein [bacterium]